MAEEQKRYADAADAHARALALDPSPHHALGQLVFLKRQLCDWRDLDALSVELRARVAQGAAGIAPFGFLSETRRSRRAIACAHVRHRNRNPGVARARASRLDAGRSIASEPRVGFVSNGFGNHPTGLLIVALIEALRGERIHVDVLDRNGRSAVRSEKRLHDAAAGWHDVVDLPPVVLAERLRAAELDVLVDLRGYGGGGIADALALRPAPVQVNWLAYPGTSGAPWIDYVIADRIVLPDLAARAFFRARRLFAALFSAVRFEPRRQAERLLARRVRIARRKARCMFSNT